MQYKKTWKSNNPSHMYVEHKNIITNNIKTVVKCHVNNMFNCTLETQQYMKQTCGDQHRL